MINMRRCSLKEIKTGGKLYGLFILLIVILFCSGCGRDISNNALRADRKPVIEPDYTDVTIPPNIAPMNFKILEEGSKFIVRASSGSNGFAMSIRTSDGTVKFSKRMWRKLIRSSSDDNIRIQVYSDDGKEARQFEPFFMHVAKEPVDPYLAYRLIHPGYYNWSNIKIMQRSIESFSEQTVIDNQILDMNCINCHSFGQYDPGKFMVHIRGSYGGTYFSNGSEITRRNPKIDAMPGGATYPAWHPGGRFVAYSSNQVRQAFYARPEKVIEVFDLVSSMIVYDLVGNDIIIARERDTAKYLQTFPSWSPDGKYLYYCRALQVNSETSMTLEEIEATKYDIVRVPFDPQLKRFGETEIVFDASGKGKSASFPRVSPDGNYIVITLADYGTFPIWHREADLYIVDLRNGESKKMDLNSSDNESYHAWSSNGKWLVFSSKRTDGRSTRPFFAYFESWDSTGKPFVLPQKDPGHYDMMLESFNIPEFVNGRIRLSPHDFAKATKGELIGARAGNPMDSLTRWEIENINVRRNPGERSIHE